MFFAEEDTDTKEYMDKGWEINQEWIRTFLNRSNDIPEVCLCDCSEYSVKCNHACTDNGRNPSNYVTNMNCYTNSQDIKKAFCQCVDGPKLIYGCPNDIQMVQY